MWIEHPAKARLPQLRELWQLVFGDSDDFLDSFFRTAYSPDRCRCVIMDGQVAAVLYWMDCSLDEQKLAYFYAVATHPDYRNRGLCRRLMENTHRLLLSQGYDGAILVPQDAGLRTMYNKMGYQNIGGLDEIRCAAGDAPVPLRAIGPHEFAALRRRCLPKDGVRQEGHSLAFLAEQLQFYAGDDFLLAGYRENGVFHGMELLGSTAAAPGILMALDCREGSFRVPGEQPFAMFLPLTDAARQPRYFGFAFD